MSKIIFTGGGTAGHVTPNIALINELKKENWDMRYIGGKNGMEKKLIEDVKIPYYGISSGKLRRYKDIKNLTDPFKVLWGILESIRIVAKEKPDVIFSKGGFVTVPVVIAGWVNRVPVIIHESDMTPGLANKISKKFCTKMCLSFPETLEYVDKKKATVTGTPIREELHSGMKLKGLEICGFTKDKPVVMLMGGSLGSKALNKTLRESLDELLRDFQIVHLCGKGNKDDSYDNVEGYKQFEYVKDDLTHMFAMADLIISRAGANSIFEFLQLGKPNILIPLSLKASRGDQILNANSFEKQGFSKVLDEDTLTTRNFIDTVKEVYNNKETYTENMKKTDLKDGKKTIIELIKKVIKK